MNRMKIPELLAPAGSMEALKASVNAGADAVYMGGKMFGARAYADNPDENGMLEALEYCHLRNRKLYLTVNTLLKEDELFNKLYSYLLPLYEAGLDAVIVQDIGVMDFIGEYFPGLDIHISTQCSLTMAEGAAAIQSVLRNPKSVTRIVPARELSLEELRTLRENTDLEIEVFIHGALCYCYSGQCLLSSLAGGRSGNRGRCAQPCRKFYRAGIEGQEYSGYLLSPKDMCTLENIHLLIEAGIDSFKIEGRMKSAEYAAGVVSAYRKVIDSSFAKIDSDSSSGEYLRNKFIVKTETDRLKEIYNRGGFNSGYLFAKNGRDMMSVLRPGHNGVCIGEIIKTNGRKALIKLSSDIGKGDVLEIISQKSTMERIYEYTCGESVKAGEITEVLTLKERLAEKGMKVYRTKCRSVLDEIDSKYIKTEKKCNVNIFLYCYKGRELKLIIETADYFGKEKIKIEVSGQTVSAAINAESTEEMLKQQLKKLGNTDFFADSIEIFSDGNVFVQVGELNKLRREACIFLKEKIIDSFKRINRNQEYGRFPENKQGSPIFEKTNKEQLHNNPYYSAHVNSLNQLICIIENDKNSVVNDIYLEMDNENADSAVMLCRENGRKLYFVLPRIIRRDNYERTLDFCLKYRDEAGFLVSNYEGMGIVKKIGAIYRTDSNLYTYNSLAKSRLFSQNVDIINGVPDSKVTGKGYTLPLELNQQELCQISDGGGEIIVYGLYPIMVSAQCIYKTMTGNCKKHSMIRLSDEKGYVFCNTSDCKNCLNTIYNSAVINLLHRFEQVKKTGCGRFRLHFTIENESEIRLIIHAAEAVLHGKVYEFPDEILGLKFTNGHFMRGVE